MLQSNLPQAVLSSKTVRLGNITIKAQEPNQTFHEAQKGIENLEKAAIEKVFIEHEPSDEKS